MNNRFAAHLFGVLGLSTALVGCGSKDSELSTAITDCQLDAHREIVEMKCQSEEKRKIALGEYSDACLKKKGFKPSGKRECLVEPTASEERNSFTKTSIECWLK
jgi:hypothetical protein